MMVGQEGHLTSQLCAMSSENVFDLFALQSIHGKFSNRGVLYGRSTHQQTLRLVQEIAVHGRRRVFTLTL